MKSDWYPPNPYAHFSVGTGHQKAIAFDKGVLAGAIAVLRKIGVQIDDRAKAMNRYYVISPTYYYHEPILDDGSGPDEPACDVVEVEAHTKREAKIRGLKELRKIHKGWINWHRDSDANPFTGLKVELIEEDSHDTGGIQEPWASQQEQGALDG